MQTSSALFHISNELHYLEMYQTACIFSKTVRVFGAHGLGDYHGSRPSLERYPFHCLCSIITCASLRVGFEHASLCPVSASNYSNADTAHIWLWLIAETEWHASAVRFPGLASRQQVWSQSECKEFEFIQKVNFLLYKAIYYVSLIQKAAACWGRGAKLCVVSANCPRARLHRAQAAARGQKARWPLIYVGVLVLCYTIGAIHT